MRRRRHRPPWLGLVVVFTPVATAASLVGACTKHKDELRDFPIGRSEEHAYVMTSLLWPTNAIPVCWETPGYDYEKSVARDAVTKTWEAVSPLRFTGWGDCDANARGVRIAIQDDRPHSKIGTSADGEPSGTVLNFTFGAFRPECQDSDDELRQCIANVTAHEFGHVVGFSHEQNRPDTPAECTEEKNGTDGDRTLGEWDALSIMNYCNPTWDNDGQLSPQDVAAVQELYGPNPDPTGPDPASTGVTDAGTE
jgi:hypothetical protein